MSKRNKKLQSFQPRPKPPTVKQIHEDIKNAKDEDVTFLLLRESSESDVLIKSDGVMADSYDDSVEDESMTSQPQEQSDVDIRYTEALEFLNLHHQLKHAPDMLHEQYKHLEKIGEELTASITQLKKQAINSEDVKT